jgi:hypothetical protein
MIAFMSRRNNCGGPKGYRVNEVGEIRSPTTSHGLDSGTAVVGRVKPETVVGTRAPKHGRSRYRTLYLTQVRYSASYRKFELH